MKKFLITFFATAAYSGFSPRAPGTVGTLWGVFIAYLASGRPYVHGITTLVVCIISIPIASEAIKLFGNKDPKQVTIDEVAGLLVSFLFIPFTPFNAILVFLLFRFFDILKPWPVSTIDQRLGGGAGVVGDDIAAGVYANISVHVVLWLLG